MVKKKKKKCNGKMGQRHELWADQVHRYVVEDIRDHQVMDVSAPLLIMVDPTELVELMHLPIGGSEV